MSLSTFTESMTSSIFFQFTLPLAKVRALVSARFGITALETAELLPEFHAARLARLDAVFAAGTQFNLIHSGASCARHTVANNVVLAGEMGLLLQSHAVKVGAAFATKAQFSLIRNGVRYVRYTIAKNVAHVGEILSRHKLQHCR